MTKVEVKNGDLDAAIKNFRRLASENEKIRKRKLYYMKPGLARKEKMKLAAKKRIKFNKKMNHQLNMERLQNQAQQVAQATTSTQTSVAAAE